MKYLKAIVVIILLFGLPAGSWYFLQSGLDWRRVKAKELSTKTDLTAVIAKQTDLMTSLKGKTTLMKIKGKESAADANLIDQFKDAYTFQYRSLSQLSGHPSLISYDYILIDTSGDVRNAYKGLDDLTLTAIVEDIALVLPHHKEKDIKMKENLDR